MNDTTVDLQPVQSPAEPAAAPSPPPEDRRAFDRRKGDRRGMVDRRSGLDRRRGPGRRRSDERRSAEEGEMTDEQFELIMAIDEYKKVNRRPFPTWTEVLDIIKALGYRKIAEPQDIR
ncbi:MAG: hypothetical protein ACE15C_05640 [Phycisphaerae bacterium]